MAPGTASAQVGGSAAVGSRAIAKKEKDMHSQRKSSGAHSTDVTALAGAMGHAFGG